MLVSHQLAANADSDDDMGAALRPMPLADVSKIIAPDDENEEEHEELPWDGAGIDDDEEGEEEDGLEALEEDAAVAAEQEDEVQLSLAP